MKVAARVERATEARAAAVALARTAVSSAPIVGAPIAADSECTRGDGGLFQLELGVIATPTTTAVVAPVTPAAGAAAGAGKHSYHSQAANPVYPGDFCMLSRKQRKDRWQNKTPL